MPDKPDPIHTAAKRLEARERVKGWIDKPEHAKGDDESTRNGELPPDPDTDDGTATEPEAEGE